MVSYWMYACSELESMYFFHRRESFRVFCHHNYTCVYLEPSLSPPVYNSRVLLKSFSTASINLFLGIALGFCPRTLHCIAAPIVFISPLRIMWSRSLALNISLKMFSNVQKSPTRTHFSQ